MAKKKATKKKTVKKAVKKSAKKTVKKSAKKAAKKTPAKKSKSAKKAAPKAKAKKTVKKAVKKAAAKKTVKKVAKKVAKKVTKPVKKAAAKPANKPAPKVAKRTTKRPRVKNNSVANSNTIVTTPSHTSVEQMNTSNDHAISHTPENVETTPENTQESNTDDKTEGADDKTDDEPFRAHSTSLKEGMSAPYFEGKDQYGNSVSGADFAGKTIVLYFYPKDFTEGCTEEACNLRDEYQYLHDKNYQVIGVSADDVDSHKKFSDEYSLPFPIIADTDKTIIHSFDVWGPKQLAGHRYDGIVRTTFIIDPQGKISRIITKVNNKQAAKQILEL